MQEAFQALAMARAFPTPASTAEAQAKATLALAEEMAESNRLTRLMFQDSARSSAIAFASLMVQSGDPEAPGIVESVKEMMSKFAQEGYIHTYTAEDPDTSLDSSADADTTAS